SQEEILSGELGMRPDRRRNEACDVRAETHERAGDGAKARPAHSRGNPTRSMWPFALREALLGTGPIRPKLRRTAFFADHSRHSMHSGPGSSTATLRRIGRNRAASRPRKRSAAFT